MAADLTAAGKTGIAINAMYDFWTPARHYQAYHGGLRILSESASARLATPITVKPEELNQTALGYSPRERTWNHLEPWPGGEWRVRDIIEYQFLADEPELALELRRGGLDIETQVANPGGDLLGLEIDSPLFDRVRTCDNHCEFCFIFQLPKGLRKSLYVKDDDYRLSFLYGNFTTLTRFTELDLERVVDDRLGPLYVSIHATDPDVRSRMLRNRRGAITIKRENT